MVDLQAVFPATGLNVDPTTQPVQTRSDDAVGALLGCSPAPQFFASSHLSVLLVVVLNSLLAHTLQTVSLVSVAALVCSRPGPQTVICLQGGFWLPLQMPSRNSPSWQVRHGAHSRLVSKVHGTVSNSPVNVG